jgi:hypothetical protein
VDGEHQLLPALEVGLEVGKALQHSSALPPMSAPGRRGRRVGAGPPRGGQRQPPAAPPHLYVPQPQAVPVEQLQGALAGHPCGRAATRSGTCRRHWSVLVVLLLPEGRACVTDARRRSSLTRWYRPGW